MNQVSKFKEYLNEFLGWVDEEQQDEFKEELVNLLHSIGDRISQEVPIQSRGEESGKHSAIEKLRQIEREIWHD